MMKKRLLALMLCVSMVITPTTAFWATEADDEDLSTADIMSQQLDGDEDPSTADEMSQQVDDDADAVEPTAPAEDPEDEEEESGGSLLSVNIITYDDKLQEWEKAGYKDVSEDTQIVLKPEQAKGPVKLSVVEKDGAKGVEFCEDKGVEYVEYTFNVDKEGLYEMYCNFYNLITEGLQIQRRLYLDGEVPYDEVNNLYFYRVYREAGEVTRNAINDDVWPKNEEVALWQNQGMSDYNGYYETPLKFYLSKGQHTFRFEYIDQDILLGDITLKGATVYPTYEQVKAEYEKKGYKEADAEPIHLEAEDSTWKNNSTIRRDSDTDPMTIPASAVDRRLNCIGGSRWKDGNQTISWTFHVDQPGLYVINMRAKQNFSTGMPSYRQIMIDGEIPFQEFVRYLFEYKDNWAAYRLEDANDNPYEFYFEEGDHTITMTVKSNAMCEVINATNDIIGDVSDIYLKVTQITGTDPDTNYEYNLDEKLPELPDELRKVSDKIQQCVSMLNNMSNLTTDMENNYRSISDTMLEYANDPNLISSDISGLTDAQTNLGDYILTLGELPLTFDYFEIAPKSYTFEVKSSNFFQRLWGSVQNFFASFVKDYDAVGSIYSGGSDMQVVDVWMARGREWGEVLKELADEDFTKEKQIAVNLNILPSGQLNAGNVSALMLSLTSGTAPDAAIGVSYSEPVEFAFRDAVVDLTQFSDYEDYASQFYEQMMIPYAYTKDGHTGMYGIPETMDFTVLMYRSDVLDSLNLSVPRTWDDLFYTTLPVLYENNMSFSFPVDTTASSNSPSSLKGMTMFLIQEGGSYYTEDGMHSALNTAEAYQAFKRWTDLYVNYGLDAESSFFSRFRNGTLPIGVGSYAAYMQILTQAPELYGRWGIAPMIGTGTGKIGEDGLEEVDNRVGGVSTTACQIMSQAEDKKDEAWEFIKWWMDSDTQQSFGREIEATMGIEARWNTANVQAFDNLPWDAKDLEIIKDQMSIAEEQPIILGGYMTTRHLVNAWNRVYLQNQNPRDALEEAYKDVDKEIRTKHEEYGFVYND